MSGLELIRTNEVKIYNLTAGRAVPAWLTDKRRRALLKKDVDLQRRVELIQDFEMPSTTTLLRESRDGSVIYAAGTYKPRIRCFETDQLSMKFERHLNTEVVGMELLSDDYSKLAMLLADRHVELHAAYGFHFRTRIPKFGRDLAFHEPSCDLYIVGSCPDVYRLNLDQGRFLKPMATSGTEANTCASNPKYGLLGVGTIEGVVDCFDPRTRERVGSLDVAAALPRRQRRGGGGSLLPEISALTFFDDGLTMAAGTSTGHVLLYDLRAGTPSVVKDHYNGVPIKRVLQHTASPDKVLSADEKGIKVWERASGKHFTAVEPPSDVHDVCQIKGSGLFTVATESPKIMTYFVPELGPAPKWCSYLDNITDELEEDEAGATAVYDDYKFVTREELEQLGLPHLIGTNLLRAYMHGFFMDVRLYKKAKEVANPFAYAEYRKDKIAEKIREGTASRLQLAKYRKQLPKINKMLATRLLAAEESKAAKAAAAASKEAARQAKEGGKDAPFAAEAEEADAAAAATAAAAAAAVAPSIDASNPLGDERFKSLFTNPDFEVDTESHEYKLLHPQGPQRLRSDLIPDDKYAALEGLESEEESELEGRPSEEESAFEEEAEAAAGRREAERREARRQAKKRGGKNSRRPRLYELKAGEEARPMEAPGTDKRERKRKKKSFGQLISKQADAEEDTIISRSGGKSMRMTVKTVTSSRSHGQIIGGKGDDKGEDGRRPHTKDRRGVKALGLAKKKKQFWRGRPVS